MRSQQTFPDFVSLIDTSYSIVLVLTIRNLSFPNDVFVKQCKMEHIVFMRWINFVLQSCGRSKLIRNIHHDLSDGVALIDVLECITGKQIDSAHRNVTLRIQKIENIILIQQFMENKNVELMTEISEYIN